MDRREVFSYFRKYCEDLERAYEVIKSKYNDSSVYSQELCKLRGYVSDEQRDIIEQLQIGECTITDVSCLGSRAYELGLLSQSGYYLLDGRYTVPIRDISGNLLALVGYYPDSRKYITTPSQFFSKDILFFNLDDAYRRSWQDYNGVVFLVEGMFDCISMRSIGLPCLATMGSTVGSVKCEILKLFKKVLYIPDNDFVGRRALNRFDKRHGWCVPPNATGIKLRGTVDLNGTEMKVKDVDNLVSWFDADSVRDSLLQFATSTNEIEELVI